MYFATVNVVCMKDLRGFGAGAGVGRGVGLGGGEEDVVDDVVDVEDGEAVEDEEGVVGVVEFSLNLNPSKVFVGARP